MKNRVCKRFWAVLMAFCLIPISAAIPVNAAIRGVSAIPLSYLDEAAYTEAGMPSPFCSYTVKAGTGTLDMDTRKVGVFGKKADDAAYKLSLLSDETHAVNSGAEVYSPLFDVSSTDAKTPNFTGKLLVYIDMATSKISDATQKGLQLGTVHAKGSTSAKWKCIAKFSKDKKIMFEGSTATVDYEAKEWHNFIAEFDAKSTTYNLWCDGEKVVDEVTYDAATIQSFRTIRPLLSYKSNIEDDLYIDNVALYMDEDYVPERYYVNQDASALSFVSDMQNGNASIDNVTGDLILPAAGSLHESSIAWASSDESVIDTTGKVTPSYFEAKNVTLTATFTNGEGANARSAVKTYRVTVPRKAFETEEGNAVVSAYDSLTEENILGQNKDRNNIVSNLSLPQTAENGVTIAWESSNTDAIATDGQVTRTSAAQPVTLRATISCGEGENMVSATREYAFSVAGDYVLYDDCTTFDHVLEYTSNLKLGIDAVNDFRSFTGISDANVKGQYLIYPAAGGVNFHMTTIYTGSVTDNTFEVAGADGEFKKFESVNKTAGESLSEFVTILGSGWKKAVYESTAALPEGTCYLKINLGYGPQRYSASVYEVAIESFAGDITFDAIRGTNESANRIVSNLVIPEGASVVSSDESVITAEGQIIRPDADKLVTLEITKDTPYGATSRKFDLTVKGNASRPEVMARRVVYKEGGSNFIIANATMKNGNRVILDAEVINSAAIEKSVMLLLTVYSSAGELLDLGCQTFAVPSSLTAQDINMTVTLSKDTAAYAGAYVAAYVWEEGSLVPLTVKYNVQAK